MASRKDEKERRRQERLAREQSEQEQARRRRTYSIVAGAVLVGAAIVAVVVAVAAGGGGDGDGHEAAKGEGKPLEVQAADPPEQRQTELTRAASAADCRLSNPKVEGRTHLGPDDTKPKYGTTPATSGSHDPVPAADGAYATTPGEIHLVHSLEHGRIIVSYKPTISDRELARLKGLFDEDPYHMILVPDRQMRFEVAATAWGHLAGCDRLTDETFDVIRTFAERYRDKGPEFVS